MSGHFKGPEGPDTARAALAFMDEHKVPPTPENYFVFASHITGAIPALSTAIEEHLAADEALSDSVCEALFQAHFPYITNSNRVFEAGGEMQAHLANAVTALREADENTRAYGQTLTGAAGQLLEIDASDPDAMRAMMDDLVMSTERMREHSNALEKRLQDTTNEVSRLRDNLEMIREEAMTDALTGVANRKRFDDVLASSVEAAAKASSPLSLMMIDIDHFKRFNDTWGHQTGDQIIRFVANVLKRLSDEGHLVARYGGEEFCVLMPGADAEAAREAAERIRTSVEAKKLLRRSTNENLGNVTVSLGVAQFAPGEETWTFVERADESLYASKKGGRNQVTVSSIADAA